MWHRRWDGLILDSGPKFQLGTAESGIMAIVCWNDWRRRSKLAITSIYGGCYEAADPVLLLHVKQPESDVLQRRRRHSVDIVMQQQHRETLEEASALLFTAWRVPPFVSLIDPFQDHPFLTACVTPLVKQFVLSFFPAFQVPGECCSTPRNGGRDTGPTALTAGKGREDFRSR